MPNTPLPVLFCSPFFISSSSHTTNVYGGALVCQAHSKELVSTSGSLIIRPVDLLLPSPACEGDFGPGFRALESVRAQKAK